MARASASYKAEPTGITLLVTTSQAFLFAQSFAILEVGRLDLGIAKHLHGICLSPGQPFAILESAGVSRSRMPSLRAFSACAVALASSSILGGIAQPEYFPTNIC